MYVDLEVDTLLITRDFALVGEFRPLERWFLRSMAFKVTLYTFLSPLEIAYWMGFVKNLKQLRVVEVSSSYGSTGYHSNVDEGSWEEFFGGEGQSIDHATCDEIHGLLKRKEIRNKWDPDDPEVNFVAPEFNYVAPEIVHDYIHDDLYVRDHIWTTYKHPLPKRLITSVDQAAHHQNQKLDPSSRKRRKRKAQNDKTGEKAYRMPKRTKRL